MTAPLDGVTVVVTRPRAQAAPFAALIAGAGGTPLLLPMLEIEPIELGPGERERLAPDAHDWTIYTSANAVLHSLRQLPRPVRSRVAAIGRATARALAEQGIAVDAVPADASESEGLLALAPFAVMSGRRVLIVTGAGGRTLLREELARRGAEVLTAVVYRRTRALPEPATLDELASRCAQGRVAVAATSAAILGSLLDTVSDARIPQLREAALLLPGERAAAAARALGWRGPLIVAKSAEDATMFAALVHAVGAPRLDTGAAC